MENDEVLVKAIKLLLGDEVYNNQQLQREKVSAVIFKHPEKLEALNALVHPATITYGNEWKAKQIAPYVLKESALLFESGSYMESDFIIGVFAPVELRISRTMKRSDISREKVLSIMGNQLAEEEKMKRCNHVINNDDMHPILPQVLHLNDLLLELASKKQ